MVDVSKLRATSIGLLNPQNKGGDLEIKKGDVVWVIKNSSGRYLKPYQVKAVGDMYQYSPNTYGFLALVETCVDNYLTSITDMDIIGLTEKDVLANAKAIIERQAELSKQIKERLKNFKLSKVKQ